MIVDRAIAAKIREWREHPGQMVRELFGATPEKFQDEGLAAFPHTPRLAMKAAKGPGKTTFLAWIGWNFLLTRPEPKCAATSISGQNLADNFWTEMSKWMGKSPFLMDKFTWTKSRIFANEHSETWWMSARTWPQSADASKQADTLAGLHADYILFLLDESGGMPDAVMAAADAALASCVEGHIVQVGNPTQLSGPLYRACSSEKHLWMVIEITGDPDDPNRCERISKQWALDQIAKWGRDNPYVLVNVFGRFPPSSFNALLGPDEVDESMNRMYRADQIGKTARILGVDVALFGDDASSIARREGLQGYPFLTYRNLDSTQGAAQVNRTWNEWRADACFVDGTGGFGAGWGDQLRLLGKAPIMVQYAGAPHDKARYYNKRAEMYFDLVEWVRRGGALPKSDRLKQALINTTYTAPKNLLILEPKEFIKTKISFSPDEADSFAQTFAEPVTARAAMVPRPRTSQDDWHPFRSDMDTPGPRAYQDYDPMR